MDEKAKLKHLLGHWAGHNDDHAGNYSEWAAKAEGWGNSEVAEILKDIASIEKETAERFRKAMELID
jgi:rubrerythrin